ncbi:BofC C-terminal domain-containing protein [Gorillibacterium sp. sgz5001074]|uniref:BofC C-terminal domain-containing protein n=1 Tax=Gorillibacterium sp. sgz5001074 TaxID=3446695 RepID=UPI003F66F059
MRKRWLTLGAYLLLAGGMAAAFMTDGDRSDSEARTAAVWKQAEAAPELPSQEATAKAMEAIKGITGTREVYLHTEYVCGEEIRQMGAMPAAEIVSLSKEHPEARVNVDESGRIHLTERVEDLGPRCRENAYFGMDKNGNLTLFEGVPEQERVIRTFFQLDVQHMKSSLPSDALNQLYSGIRISDLADYNSVLSTFSEYASEHAEPVSGSHAQ